MIVNEPAERSDVRVSVDVLSATCAYGKKAVVLNVSLVSESSVIVEVVELNRLPQSMGGDSEQGQTEHGPRLQRVAPTNLVDSSGVAPLNLSIFDTSETISVSQRSPILRALWP